MASVSPADERIDRRPAEAIAGDADGGDRVGVGPAAARRGETPEHERGRK